MLAGFAGATADAFQLFELFEKKLKEHARSLPRAAVELAKQWRTDRMLRRLEALLLVADREHLLVLSGAGDVHRARPGRRRRRWRPSARAAPTPWPRRGRCSRTPTLDARAGRRGVDEAGGRDLHLHQRQPDRRGAVVNPQELTPREIVAELDRYMVGQARRQAGGGHGAAQPLAAPAGGGRAARRDPPQEHHPHRPHRRGQDRDRPPPGAAGRAPPSSRSRPPSSPRSATSAATSTRWSATWSRRPSSWSRKRRWRSCASGPARRPRSGSSTRSACGGGLGLGLPRAWRPACAGRGRRSTRPGAAGARRRGPSSGPGRSTTTAWRWRWPSAAVPVMPFMGPGMEDMAQGHPGHGPGAGQQPHPLHARRRPEEAEAAGAGPGGARAADAGGGGPHGRHGAGHPRGAGARPERRHHLHRRDRQDRRRRRRAPGAARTSPAAACSATCCPSSRAPTSTPSTGR